MLFVTSADGLEYVLVVEHIRSMLTGVHAVLSGNRFVRRTFIYLVGRKLRFLVIRKALTNAGIVGCQRKGTFVGAMFSRRRMLANGILYRFDWVRSNAARIVCNLVIKKLHARLILIRTPSSILRTTSHLSMRTSLILMIIPTIRPRSLDLDLRLKMWTN